VTARCYKNDRVVLLLGLLFFGFSIAADSRPSLAAQGASTRAQGWPSKVDGSEALPTAVALVQQGRVEEAEQQARLALGSRDTRPVANSVLGAIRLQQKRLDGRATFLRESEPVGARPLGAHLSFAQVHTAATPFRSRGIMRSFGRIPGERPALHRRELAWQARPSHVPVAASAAGS
jgi:hypothetical protein